MWRPTLEQPYTPACSLDAGKPSPDCTAFEHINVVILHIGRIDVVFALRPSLEITI
jgi:hypothetical protein